MKTITRALIVCLSVIAWTCTLAVFVVAATCVGSFFVAILQLPAPVLVFVTLGTLIIYGLGATSHRQKP